MAELGYGAVVQDRSGSLFSIANATFFRAAKLEMTWSEDRSRTLLTSFRMRSAPDSRTIFVVNSHLEGHPYKPHERFNQVKSALSRVSVRQAALNQATADAHVVLLGDLNSTRSDGVYRLLYRGRLEGGWTERYLPERVLTQQTVSHPFALRDAYTSCAAFALPFTRAVPGNACVIDYIFISESARVAAVLQYWRGAAGTGVALPNGRHPSDHIPLGVVIDV